MTVIVWVDGESWMRSGAVLWMRFIIDAEERTAGILFVTQMLRGV
jgi:hypothetical protein